MITENDKKTSLFWLCFIQDSIENLRPGKFNNHRVMNRFFKIVFTVCVGTALDRIDKVITVLFADFSSF